MMKKLLFLMVIAFILAGCGMVQSIVKSTFPYTTTLVIPASSKTGIELSATSMATSFDQDFSKSGNNGSQVSEVRIVSARLQSREPSDFNIGNLVSARIYMSKADGKEEVLVASRTDITPGVGNSLVLDIDNSHFLDERVREPKIRIRMEYKLRTTSNVDVQIHLVLGLSAYPAGN